MTIGMLIESLVSKAGALTGRFVDATPFQRSEGKEQDPIGEVAEELESRGFHRHGGEQSCHPPCMPIYILFALLY